MDRKLGIIIILIIAWVGIAFIMVSDYIGFGFISVVSNSMKHENETLFLQFWKESGCNSTCVKGFPIPEGFQGGDLLISQRNSDYGVGDILSYQKGHYCEDEERKKCKYYDIVIHRIIGMNETHAIFMGDNMEYMEEYMAKSNITEEAIEREFVTGKVISKIPKLGLVRALLNCWTEGCDSLDCIANGNCSLG